MKLFTLQSVPNRETVQPGIEVVSSVMSIEKELPAVVSVERVPIPHAYKVPWSFLHSPALVVGIGVLCTV